jgi:pimeloyl-ACP methyl ester carboxylesterase
MKAPKPRAAVSFAALVIAAAATAVGSSLATTGERPVRTVAEPSATAPASEAAKPLRWHSCGEGLPAAAECAELRVPLDYARPGGEKITLGLARARATDPDARIGSLLFNPGGPGGEATTPVIAAAGGAKVFTDETRRRFDVIGLDPRGVGRSTRIKCDPAIWNETVSLLPKTAAEYAALVSHNRRLGRSCAEQTGRLINFLDANSQARDIEEVRKALGEGKLNYLGISYGSFLGTTYASMFPGKIRTMAIDGILDHSLSETTMFTNEAMTVESTLNRFIAWCDATPSCALHGRAGAVVDKLLADADQRPLPAPACAASGACRPLVTGEDIRLNLQPKLFFKDPNPDLGFPGWPGTAADLAQAAGGDASAFSQPIATSSDDGDFAGLIIACMEFPAESRNFAELQGKMLLGRTITPRMLGMSQTWTLVAGCIDWPVPASNPPKRLTVRKAPPILLVNSTHDPSDNYIWAHGVLAQLPTNAVLLTRDGDGHSSWFLRPNSQTVAAMERYLITGQTPAPNTVLPN